MENEELQDASSRSQQTTRRRFIKQASMLAGGAVLLGILPSQRLALGAVSRTYVAGNYSLELDGQVAATLKSFEGGFAKADVVSEPPGPAPYSKKHIAQPKYQDIVMETDPVLSKPLYDWLASTLGASAVRKNGAIITASYDLKEMTRLQFNNALISEVTIPACDGASKEAGYLALRLSPEFAAPMAGNNVAVKTAVLAKQKQWLTSNFRLTIPGLDCSRVIRIEPMTIKRIPAQDQVGAIREFVKDPGRLEFSNLSFSVAEISAGGFYAWYQDMVIKGNSGDKNERPGKLELLTSDLQTVLFTLTFSNLGIFAFTPDKAEASSEKTKQVKIDLYCERITL